MLIRILKKLKWVILATVCILIFMSNFIFLNKESYTYSGQTLQCFNEWPGDFKTRDDDWLVSLKIINAHEGKLTLKYKGRERFLVEAIDILSSVKEISINIKDGNKELLNLNKLSFENNDFEKTKKTIEIKINSDENLYEKFNPKDIMNLDVELDFEFGDMLGEKYWSTISISPINKLNFEYLKMRYIKGNPYFEKREW